MDLYVRLVCVVASVKVFTRFVLGNLLHELTSIAPKREAADPLGYTGKWRNIKYLAVLSETSRYISPNGAEHRHWILAS